MTYVIPEFNMKQLERKIKYIKRKCDKKGIAFNFEIKNEYVKPVRDDNGRLIYIKFYEVETSGAAVINGWKYIATIKHETNGNIIKGISEDIEIPRYYYNCKAYCDHCKTYRDRKETFLLMNDKKQLKQVGKSCLLNYTGSLDAELVADYYQYYSLLENATQFDDDDLRIVQKTRDKVVDVLSIADEIIKEKGYVKVGNADCTKELVLKALKDVKENKCDKTLSKAAIKWLEKQEAKNTYMNNLKVICSEEYVDYENVGILVSLIPVYQKAIIQEKQNKKSEHVGQIKERLSISVQKMFVVTSWENSFGETYIYQIIDTNGNIYTWKTSNIIDCENVKKVSGTVKEHKQYKEVKQTELTRCKCSYN